MSNCPVTNLLILKRNLLGIRNPQHTEFIREGRGTSQHMKIGQEEPNQSDNISVAAAPISNTEFSRGMLDLYPWEKQTGRSWGKHTLS